MALVFPTDFEFAGFHGKQKSTGLVTVSMETVRISKILTKKEPIITLGLNYIIPKEEYFLLHNCN